MPVAGIDPRQIETFNKEYSKSPKSFTLGLEARTLNCARKGVNLEGLEVRANLDVDPGPITGAKDPMDWEKSLRSVKLDVTAQGKLSKKEEQIVEEGARRSPVHHIFNRALDVRTSFRYT